MSIHYVVHLSDDHKVDVHAEKVNLGMRKIWFYDADDNLQALFRWESINGFSIEGSASGQILIDELAHESKMEKRKVESLEKTEWPVLAALENVDQGLEKVKGMVSSAWLKIYDVQAKSSEAKLLIGQRRGDLLRYRARLEDHLRDLESKIKRITDDMTSLLNPEK